MSLLTNPVGWAIRKYIGDPQQVSIELQAVIRDGRDPVQLIYEGCYTNKTLREFLREFRPILAVLAQNKEWMHEHLDEVLDYLDRQACTTE